MKAAQAKRVPLRELLAALGLQPARRDPAKGEQWYLSPFREETSASFKVDEAKNLWYDFGAAAGGNVLDFAMTISGWMLPRRCGRLTTWLAGCRSSTARSPPTPPGCQPQPRRQRRRCDRSAADRC